MKARLKGFAVIFCFVASFMVMSSLNQYDTFRDDFDGGKVTGSHSYTSAQTLPVSDHGHASTFSDLYNETFDDGVWNGVTITKNTGSPGYYINGNQSFDLYTSGTAIDSYPRWTSTGESGTAIARANVDVLVPGATDVGFYFSDLDMGSTLESRYNFTTSANFSAGNTSIVSFYGVLGLNCPSLTWYNNDSVNLVEVYIDAAGAVSVMDDALLTATGVSVVITSTVLIEIEAVNATAFNVTINSFTERGPYTTSGGVSFFDGDMTGISFTSDGAISRGFYYYIIEPSGDLDPCVESRSVSTTDDLDLDVDFTNDTRDVTSMTGHWFNHTYTGADVTSDANGTLFYDPEKVLGAGIGQNPYMDFSAPAPTNNTVITFTSYNTYNLLFILSPLASYAYGDPSEFFPGSYAIITVDNGIEIQVFDGTTMGFISLTTYDYGDDIDFEIHTYTNNTFDVYINGVRYSNFGFTGFDPIMGGPIPGPIASIFFINGDGVQNLTIDNITNDWGADNETFNTYAFGYDVSAEADWWANSGKVTGLSRTNRITYTKTCAGLSNVTWYIEANKTGLHNGYVYVDGTQYLLGDPLDPTIDWSGTYTVSKMATTSTIIIYQINASVGLNITVATSQTAYVNITSPLLTFPVTVSNLDAYDFLVSPFGIFWFVIHAISWPSATMNATFWFSSGAVNLNFTNLALNPFYSFSREMGILGFVPGDMAVNGGGYPEYTWGISLTGNTTIQLESVEIVIHDEEIHITGITIENPVSMFYAWYPTIVGTDAYVSIDNTIPLANIGQVDIWINGTLFANRTDIHAGEEWYYFNTTVLDGLSMKIRVMDSSGNYVNFTIALNICAFVFDDLISNAAEYTDLTGTGTSGDPYTMTSMTMECNSTITGIEVLNSMHYFVFDNITIVNVVSGGFGVGIINSSNIIVTRCTIPKTGSPVSIDNVFHPGFTSDNITVTDNDFVKTANVSTWALTMGTSPTNLTWSGNAYGDYFDTYPYACVTVPGGTLLDTEYEVTASINDSAPVYHEDMYNRTETAYLMFSSSINNENIPFTNMIVFIDGDLATTYGVAVHHVLFTVVTYDLTLTNVYSNTTYNYNSTGMYVRVIIDIAESVYFSYYSTIDYFGLDFNLVKLFIDGNRVTRYDPMMIPMNVNVTILDFANVTIYTNVMNLSVTGVYLDIGLPIAVVIIANQYSNRTIDFTMTRSGTSVTFEIPPSSSYLLRLATGAYSYSVSDADTGEVLYHATLNIVGSKTLSFGFADVTVPVIPEMGYTFLDTLVSAGVFAVVVFVVMLGYNVGYFKKIKNTFITTRRP